jgi:hypothetical protein
VSTKFQRQIRSYNNALSFASLGATIDDEVQGHKGVYTFKIGGALYHNLPEEVPASKLDAKFAQIYVIGGNDAKEAAMRKHKCGVNVDSKILLQLQHFISENNSYAQFYRTVNQELDCNPAATFVLRALNDPSKNPNTYNQPRVDEIGFVLDTFDEEKISPRDIVLHKLNGGIKRVTDLFPGYLALRYPLFFPRGEQGWIPKYRSLRKSGKLTCLYICLQLMLKLALHRASNNSGRMVFINVL